MNAELKAKWIEALRSGKYEQGLGYLHSEKTYCCLGVLHEVMGGEWIGDARARRTADAHDSNWLSYDILERNVQLELAKMNDGMMTHRHSFSAIADYIEANL
jgi:hypothetical protein